VYFSSFAITSPWRGTIHFICSNFNPSFQGWLVPILVKIGPVVLEKIFKRPHPIFTFFDDLFEEDLALYLNKLQFPSL
jgi:hypothetical protein